MKRAAWREKAARQAIRARERAELVRLRLLLRGAKEARSRLLREARGMCRKARLSLREKLKAERLALLEKARAARRAERQTCSARKAAAKRAGARAVDSAKSELIEAARAQKLQRRQAGQRVRRSAAEAISESDDAVLRDIPAELHVVWEKQKRRIKGHAKKSRAEAFLQWAEENPEEVIALQQADADREVARLVAEYSAMRKKSRLRKTKQEIAAELAAVPF